jgi:hypothetical protein
MTDWEDIAAAQRQHWKLAQVFLYSIHRCQYSGKQELVTLPNGKWVMFSPPTRDDCVAEVEYGP